MRIIKNCAHITSRKNSLCAFVPEKPLKAVIKQIGSLVLVFYRGGRTSGKAGLIACFFYLVSSMFKRVTIVPHLLLSGFFFDVT